MLSSQLARSSPHQIFSFGMRNECATAIVRMRIVQLAESCRAGDEPDTLICKDNRVFRSLVLYNPGLLGCCGLGLAGHCEHVAPRRSCVNSIFYAFQAKTWRTCRNWHAIIYFSPTILLSHRVMMTTMLTRHFLLLLLKRFAAMLGWLYSGNCFCS